MFPFWENVIAPVIEAVGARRVVEIGALRGETTVRMLERLGPECELHVIDPLPQFDPAEHERAFPGRYIFHLGISHDVLPGLPPADVALVDGDHNWFTVYHELRMLADTARERRAVRCPCSCCTTCAGPTAGATSTTSRPGSPRSSASRYRKAGMRPGVKSALPQRRDEPDARQRRDRGRSTQRRDDRPRGLHGRAPRAAALRRAAPVLRPGHRGRGASRWPRTRALRHLFDRLESPSR